LKSLLKFISQAVNAERVSLFEKKGNSATELYGGSSEIPSEIFDEIFSRSEKRGVTEISDENMKKFLPAEKSIKKVFAKAFRVDEYNFVLFGFFNKEKGFGKKKTALFEFAAETLAEELKARRGGESFSVLEDFFVPAFLYDKRTGEAVIATKGFYDLLGFNLNDWTKRRKTILRRIPPKYFPRFRRLFAELDAGKATYAEFEITDNFGIHRFLRLYASSVGDNYVFGLLLDVTNEKNLQRRLESSNAKFKTLLEIANDLIFSLNRAGYFMFVNDEGAASLGFSGNELIGKHFLEIVAEEDKPSIALAFQKILKTTEAVTFDVRFVDARGKEIPFKITATSLRSGDEVTGMLGYGKNFQYIVNEKKKLKELNEKLLEANRLLALERDRAAEQVSELEKLNDLKNEFISNISHELRTPLASIVGFAEAIAEDASLSQDLVREFNAIILEEGKRLTRLIDDILDYSRLEEGEPDLRYEEFNLVDILSVIVDNFKVQAEAKKVGLKSEIPQAEFLLEADMKKIERALSNVLSNAIKFTPEGGTVTVSAGNFLNEVSVTVEDTGVGIPKEEIKHLFEKFKKVTKPGAHVPGAGLGLAITKKIIDIHGGSIKIASEPNKGTTVTITLPKKRSK